MYQTRHFAFPLCLILLLVANFLEAQPGNNPSRFGLDYVFPTDPQYQDKPFSKIYREAGLRWVNFADVKWQYLEPREPARGTHSYEWDKLDRAVRHWQSHGFDITMTLRLGKAWFTGPSKIEVEFPPVLRAMANFSDRLPKKMHFGDYKNWVSALAERYDADGKNDMPGLQRPVLYYQIGNEYGNPVFFSGTIEDYFVLLRMASESIRSAAPYARIIPNGLRTNDLFHNDPDATHTRQTLQEFYARLEELHREGWKRGLQLDEQIIGTPDLFDLLDAGGNGSWHTAAEGYYAYVKRIQEQSNNGLPIWDMEARNEPLLTPIETTHMHMELGVPQGRHILNLLKWVNHRDHEKAVNWYRKEQARLTAKVFVSKFAAGYQKVFMGMPMDWDKGVSALTWPNPYMGFLDSRSRKWPAYFTLQFLIRELDGFTTATRVPSEKGIRLFKFTFPKKQEIWVAWAEDESPRGMNDPLVRRKLTLNGLHPKKALEIPMKPGEIKEKLFSNTPEGCEIQVSSTPVFLFQ